MRPSNHPTRTSAAVSDALKASGLDEASYYVDVAIDDAVLCCINCLFNRECFTSNDQRFGCASEFGCAEWRRNCHYKCDGKS